MKKHPAASLFSYGIVGLPLAFVGLPIYVHAPKFYASELGVSLTIIGAILLIIRIADALLDPIIGYLSDLYNKTPGFRYKIITFSAPLLALGFYLLFNPQSFDQHYLAIWFAFTLFILYLVYSAVNINYQSLAAEISTDYNERTKITGIRESLALVGVLLASVLPQILSDEYGTLKGFFYFTLIFIPVLGAAVLVMQLYSPRPQKIKSSGKPALNIFTQFFSVIKNAKFRKLLIVYVFNGIAASIPATLVLFFIDDVIDGKDHTGYFLMIYFLSGALGMPVWNFLAGKYGKKSAWMLSMLLSVVTFMWAFMLGSGDIMSYYLICILSGINLGADLALPPSLLADIIDLDKKDENPVTGSYFGLWNLVTKLNLALAAGITLPILDSFGYRPDMDNSASSLMYLSATYALLPCIFKLLALVILGISSIDVKPRKGKKA